MYWLTLILNSLLVLCALLLLDIAVLGAHVLTEDTQLLVLAILCLAVFVLCLDLFWGTPDIVPVVLGALVGVVAGILGSRLSG